MSLSDDEDFLSADEDGFGDDDELSSNVDKEKPSRIKGKNIDRNESETIPVIESLGGAKPSLKQDQDEETKLKAKQISNISGYRREKQSEFTVQDEIEDEEDEEEVLAKIRARISERNMKIAQKFSQESTTKPSDPIPVAKPSGSFKVNDIEYPSIPESEIKSGPPPAPPPTPALSSSFNSSETISASPSGTQYGWRVPSKVSKPNPPDDPKIEQTRLALDRLSASLSQADNKNLFEKVAEDIKKVSLAPKDSPSTDSQAGGANYTGIPLISDLGSTLGGWKWGGASKLLASASQVTLQVGSVLESVVNISQPSQVPPESHVKNTEASEHNRTKRVIESGNEQLSASQAPTTSESGLNPNDGLMDFTLNAMESLGKKAFGVMTERNESGSLQIKGLGRPWEHLMNVNRPQHPDDDVEPTGNLALKNRSKKDD